MTDKGDHIVWAAEAVAVFQKHSRSGDEHSIADLICDLGHLADDLGFDFLSEIKRGIGHWYAEQHRVTFSARTRQSKSSSSRSKKRSAIR